MGIKKMKNSGLDLEAFNAKMNALDHKMEKEKEVKQENDKLEEQLQEFASAALILKDTGRLLHDTTMKASIAGRELRDTMRCNQSIQREINTVVESARNITLYYQITDESAERLSTLYDDYLTKHETSIKEFAEKEKETLKSHREKQKEELDSFMTYEKKRLASLRSDINRSVSRSGVWLSTKVFWWLFGITLFLFGFTLTMILLLCNGNIRFC